MHDENGDPLEPSDDELNSVAADTILSLLRDFTAPRASAEDPEVRMPCVGAALLDFAVWSRLMPWMGPEHSAGVTALSARLVGPAADMCRTLSGHAKASA